MFTNTRKSCAALALCLLPPASLAGAGATSAAPPSAELVAFVGEKISVEHFPDTPEEGAAGKAEDERVLKETGMRRVSLRLNTRLKATYRVIQVVAGRQLPATIEFITADHYGRPRFAEQSPVLLYVKKDAAGAYVHVRYPYAYVYPTRDGGWAACSTGTELPSRDTEELLRAVHPVDFAPAVSLPADTLRARLTQATALDRIAHYDIAGDTAVCRQGLRVDELVALHAKTVAAN